MLSDEETSEIKQKIISQVESTFPVEQIAGARQQIESMNSQQLENFLERNKMIKDSNKNGQEEAIENDCVFCSIVSDKIHSVKIDENEKAIAILEINPISRGHVLIIPKEHTNKSPKEAQTLAKKVSGKIKKKFSPKDIEISKSKLFGHETINVLPVYMNENFNSERKHATMEELESIKEELEKKKPEKISKKPKIEKIKEIFYLPKRIP